MKKFSTFIMEEQTCPTLSKKQMLDLEKFASRLLQKCDIDIEFTKHFGDRVGDGRNNPCIGLAELQQLFKKIGKDKARKIKSHGEGEAVLVDLQKDLNLPFAIEVSKDGVFELRMISIIRKKDFVTTDKKIAYEGWMR